MMRILVAFSTFLFFSSSLVAEQREPCTVVIFDDVVTDCVTFEKIEKHNLSIGGIKILYNTLMANTSVSSNIGYIGDDSIVLFINKKDNKITGVELNDNYKD